ncbi:MAG: hypothetical protein D6820_07720 [Lentisphaerae bacterium]|nr:MAG: hypothetical protein D6820_07720 [Lentisphaerota bacterium]
MQRQFHHRELPAGQTRPLIARQKEILDRTLKLLAEAGSLLGNVQATLTALSEHEMPEAVSALKNISPGKDPQFVTRCEHAIVLQTRILAQLQSMPPQLEFEATFKTRADLLSGFQKIVKLQVSLVEAATRRQNKAAGALSWSRLSLEQDNTATRLAAWQEKATLYLKREKDDFAEQLHNVLGILKTEHIYPAMLEAAEALEKQNGGRAIPIQTRVKEVLLRCLNIFNDWRMKKAKETLAKAHDQLKKLKDKLDQMEKAQEAIAEKTRDLIQRDLPPGQLKAELAKMDKQQEAMKEEVEKLAQDLYQFPELPVSGELNSKMREIYEDVQQAAGSANEPAKEIAVQKEDSLLDAIKNTKERVEDVEMWLPDKPDNVKWDMETFDASEFPEIPLVDLPDELEDMVGDLLDQAQAIDEASQDSTGNNMFADAEMGWGVSDGPMPNFSAKGKSGNTRPNDNEMTGRSGAGREGQSNGELVENNVKGLEGRETHARRTQDPLQTGNVTEDPDSTLKARSTGGGKLGGDSESIGMFGNAPRRDLQNATSENIRKLRLESEALYAKSRMLYLGSPSSLGTLATELRTMDRYSKNIQDLSIRRRILRRLSDAQTQLNSGAAINMPVRRGSQSYGNFETEDIRIDRIDPKFRKIVSQYYNNLD